jgi:uncharacterized cupredoxin-like copper-binding protein
MKKVLTVITLTMLVLGACAQAGTAPSGPSKVTVSMDEWSVKLSQNSVPAGEVTFALKNNGKLSHELAILKTNLAHDKIPARANDATKVEEPGSIGEIEDVEAGTSKEATFTLTPGNYVLICNEQAHYQAGMHIAFVVR